MTKFYCPHCKSYERMAYPSVRGEVWGTVDTNKLQCMKCGYEFDAKEIRKNKEARDD